MSTFNNAVTKLAPGAKFTDLDFKPGSDALYWRSMGESKLDMAETEREFDIEWKRASDVFTDVTLFGHKGIEPTDMTQGYIGNCWFISGVSAMAEYPGRVEKLFVNTTNSELSKRGIYGINIYTLGLPQTIIVDDYLPLRRGDDGSYKALYARISDDRAIFGPIIEKAFAKRYGNYEHIIAGFPTDAIRVLTGSPMETIYHDETSVEKLWQRLAKHDLEQDFITCGTSDFDERRNKSQGLAEMHAYTVMGTLTLSNGTRLVKIRNPWGEEGFTGRYSDSSRLWDATSKAEAGFVKANDGIFFTDINTYIKKFTETFINLDVSDWASDKFMKLNDRT